MNLNLWRYAGIGPHWRGSEVWNGVCQLRCHPGHLTAVQNDEFLPKIALVLLQKRDINKTKLNQISIWNFSSITKGKSSVYFVQECHSGLSPRDQIFTAKCEFPRFSITDCEPLYPY
ncbi:hypothetical protein AVEN_151694-1 [Araneus ventricosus]|uniref:Uncharacterized protein n=1 Tax=Araneus ventricosus TaxID=182803 RepID=A0A4Y2MS14_ARAVE|nr:hypothetical protein AVEN_151694-1 [Araneus ventricosus]